MRALGIDFGTKRTGLAVGSDLGLASPLPALLEKDPDRRWNSLLEVIRRQRITDLVVGMPLNMDGSAGPMARMVGDFAHRLGTETGLPVHLVDESLTSYAAESTLPRKDLRRLRGEGLVDSRAAAIILQDYLDRRFPQEPL